jgi:hypothetical protein
MGPVGGLDSFTSTRPPRFGDPSKEDYPSYRRDVELWLKLTEVVPVKQGVALVGCLSGEPKEFAKTMPDDLLFSDDSGKNVLMHLDKAYQNSLEMILNSRVSAFLDYQRLPSMSISTYIAGFYARLDNLSQLQMPDELKGHLLLKQANLESDQKSMIIASARGSYKVRDVADSMRQLYGERQDIPKTGLAMTTSSTFATSAPKKFCTYCKKKNHVEADCWSKRKMLAGGNSEAPQAAPETRTKQTYVTYISTQRAKSEHSALIDSGAVYTVIGVSTLNKIMRAYGIGNVEKCQPLSMVHRFGTNGTPIEPEFGVILPWISRDIMGMDHAFHFRADVLEGEYPLLVGCPTLMAMAAVLSFKELNLSAVINDKKCDLPLRQSGNHIFMDHSPTVVEQATNQTIRQDPAFVGHYEAPADDMIQFFRRPDHC